MLPAHARYVNILEHKLGNFLRSLVEFGYNISEIRKPVQRCKLGTRFCCIVPRKPAILRMDIDAVLNARICTLRSNLFVHSY